MVSKKKWNRVLQDAFDNNSDDDEEFDDLNGDPNAIIDNNNNNSAKNRRKKRIVPSYTDSFYIDNNDDDDNENDALKHIKTKTSLETIAGVAGNVLEWYDFAVFGYFGDVLSEVFFPASSKRT